MVPLDLLIHIQQTVFNKSCYKNTAFYTEKELHLQRGSCIIQHARFLAEISLLKNTVIVIPMESLLAWTYRWYSSWCMRNAHAWNHNVLTLDTLPRLSQNPDARGREKVCDHRNYRIKAETNGPHSTAGIFKNTFASWKKRTFLHFM